MSDFKRERFVYFYHELPELFLDLASMGSHHKNEERKIIIEVGIIVLILLLYNLCILVNFGFLWLITISRG